MSDKVYFVDSIAQAIAYAQGMAQSRYGQIGLIRKVEASDIVSKSRTVKVQLQFGEAREWFTIQMKQTESGWAPKSEKEKEMNANPVVIATRNWDGYGSTTVYSMSTRQSAIFQAHSVVKDIRKSDQGRAFDSSYFGTDILYDDGERILFHIRDGYDFKGMRINDTFVYCDTSATVTDEVWEGNGYEEYEVHTLSIDVSEIWAGRRSWR